jgi:hypothetical protein
MPGMTPEQLQRVMGDRPAVPAPPLELQQETEHRPVVKKLRPKGDKPET